MLLRKLMFVKRKKQFSIVISSDIFEDYEVKKAELNIIVLTNINKNNNNCEQFVLVNEPLLVRVATAYQEHFFSKHNTVPHEYFLKLNKDMSKVGVFLQVPYNNHYIS